MVGLALGRLAVVGLLRFLIVQGLVVGDGVKSRGEVVLLEAQLHVTRIEFGEIRGVCRTIHCYELLVVADPIHRTLIQLILSGIFAEIQLFLVLCHHVTLQGVQTLDSLFFDVVFPLLFRLAEPFLHSPHFRVFYDFLPGVGHDRGILKKTLTRVCTYLKIFFHFDTFLVDAAAVLIQIFVAHLKGPVLNDKVSQANRFLHLLLSPDPSLIQNYLLQRYVLVCAFEGQFLL